MGDVTPRARPFGTALNPPAEEGTHRRHRPDYWLLLLSIGLLVIGLVVIYSISPALGLANGTSSSFYVTRQMLAIGLSAIAFIAGSSIPLQNWRRWCKPLLALAIVATILALIIPVNPAYPAHRWVRLGSLSFQSVEVVKFALLVWLATFLGDRIRNNTITDTKSTLKPLMIALVLTGLIVAGIQSDFGSAVVIMAMMGTMAYVAGMPFKRLLLVGSILLVLGVLAISAVPYRRERLVAFLHPTSNCQSTGYQACQALISVGSGGLIGLGLGRSVQAYGYLPEAANDSIFAIYAEKFGFIGVAVLLALFTALFTKLKTIAERAPDNFSRLFVIGTLVWLSVQTVINIGAMIGLLPLKGITLPLVSYGGTSVVFIMAALGVVFQMSRYTHYVAEDDSTFSSRRSASRENRIDRRRIGGHITPILAVAAELKKLQPDVQLIYIGQRGDQLSDVPAKSQFIDEVYSVRAGKFRRYHGEGIKQIFDVPTLAKNIRDAWRVLIGAWQSYRLLGKIKPACVFVKGGFVGFPVGLAAAARHIPYVTHDSDALPGLTNRAIARWAVLHAVALPAEVYSYPQDKTVTVGVPLQAEFQPVDAEHQKTYRRQLGLDETAKMLFITGGGNGALSLNAAVAHFVPALLELYPGIIIVHVAGRLHEAALSQKYDELLKAEQRQQVVVKGFVSELYAYSGAADVVITRAGATNLAEFALQHKACVVVPNPMLAGGHQVKNAEYLAKQQAVVCVTEAELRDEPHAMEQAVRKLFDNPQQGQAMGQRFATFAKPDAAEKLAMLLLEEAKSNSGKQT